MPTSAPTEGYNKILPSSLAHSKVHSWISSQHLTNTFPLSLPSPDDSMLCYILWKCWGSRRKYNIKYKHKHNNQIHLFSLLSATLLITIFFSPSYTNLSSYFPPVASVRAVSVALQYIAQKNKININTNLLDSHYFCQGITNSKEIAIQAFKVCRAECGASWWTLRWEHITAAPWVPQFVLNKVKSTLWVKCVLPWTQVFASRTIPYPVPRQNQVFEELKGTQVLQKHNSEQGRKAFRPTSETGSQGQKEQPKSHPLPLRSVT